MRADNLIIKRVAELSQKYNVSITEMSLAWLLNKVISPVVGATKLPQLDGMANAVTSISHLLLYRQLPQLHHFQSQFQQL